MEMLYSQTDLEKKEQELNFFSIVNVNLRIIICLFSAFIILSLFLGGGPISD